MFPVVNRKQTKQTLRREELSAEADGQAAEQQRLAVEGSLR
jgi:hypothetical protein